MFLFVARETTRKELADFVGQLGMEIDVLLITRPLAAAQPGGEFLGNAIDLSEFLGGDHLTALPPRRESLPRFP